MATICRVAPVVFKRTGKNLTEEKSNLFNAIKKAVGDYDTAWNLWGYTKTSDFKQKYGSQVEYDELGEVTFPSLIKALGLQDAYNEQKSIEEVTRDYGFNTIVQRARTAISKINDFNSKENKFTASLKRVADGYKIEVSRKNANSVRIAREQSYNYALTGEILDLMKKIGFNVEWAADPKYDGLFNPENATLKDGLVTIISLAKGVRGEQALPEEFSHMIIEGLIDHPLVQRLLNGLTNTQVKEILGDTYDQYAQKYNNDGLKMTKEAAGKLLAAYISNKGTIQPVVEQKKSLLTRIWNWAKNLFSKITNKDLRDAGIRAEQSIAQIYNLIVSDEVIPLLDTKRILTSENLFKLKEEYNDLAKVANLAETTLAKLYHYRAGKFDKTSRERAASDKKAVEALQETFGIDDEGMETGNPYQSIVMFLDNTERQLAAIGIDIGDAQRKENKGELSDLKSLNELAKIYIEASNFIIGYKDLLNEISLFAGEENRGELGLTAVDAEALANAADICLKKIRNIESWIASGKRSWVLKAARTQYKEDKVVGIGKDRDEIMALEQVVDHASRDINFVDRWLSALSDADDSLLTIFDGIVKNQQYDRDMEMVEWRAQISALNENLRNQGYSSDFMYEMRDGEPTLRIISPYDWDTYNQKLKEKREELKQLQKEHDLKEDWFRKELSQWKNKQLIKIYVDPKYDNMPKGKIPDDAIFEYAPNPKIYSRYANRIEQLAPAQKEYYEKMMHIKRLMMTKIPHRGQGIYKTINISKDFVEGLISTSGNPIKTVMDYCSRKLVRRPDDIGFGTGDDYREDIKAIIAKQSDPLEAAKQIIQYLENALDEDIQTVVRPSDLARVIRRNKGDVEKATKDVTETIASLNFYVIDTDFAQHTIQRLPIYYTRPLRDKKMLSLDFSSSLLAYSAMAVNYEKMNEVVDLLEMMRSYIKEDRGVRQNEGNKSMVSKFSILDRTYKSFINMTDTKISGRIDDYMSSVVYEQRKNYEGTIDVMGVNLDVAKTLDTIKDYTGLIGLGFNTFSTVSNISMGKLQQWIEAYAGEYFNFSDYAKAIAQYAELMPGCFAEMSSPVKKNKLSLLIQMFDPLGDMFENMRDENMQGLLTKILGNGALAYIGMNAGEHLLHCQTMLAILNNIKLIDLSSPTNEKISLYDALEVQEVNGISKLVLKDNLAYEKELIDNTGKPATNKNYGRPLRDENGKIKTDWIPISKLTKELQSPKAVAKVHGTYNPKDYRDFMFKKRRVIRKVNDSLNGAFSANDKGAGHKWAVVRLIMQFRQWMPAHYERRFAKEHYDNDLDMWRAGYYTTTYRVLNGIMKDLYKDIKRGELQFIKYKDKLSEHEKANLRRANAEIAEFCLFMWLCRLGGRVKDRDRSWLDKMALYQIHRMRLEVGASMPINSEFFNNIFTLLQQPAASLDTFERFAKFFQVWDMFDEIQSGRYQGMSEWEKNVLTGIPAVYQIKKAIDFDDNIFSVFEKK